MNFKIDIKNKIKNMKKCIKNDWQISNIDVQILIQEFEKQEKMIKLMAKDLSTDSHSEDWIVDYYEKEARKCLKMKEI